MSSFFRAMALMLILGSCGGQSSHNSAPRNLDDACSIVSERPEYLRAFRAVERKYGVPVPSLMAIIYQESKFISDNRPPHRYALGVIPVGRQSSAVGYSQALDATWREYQDEVGGSRARRQDVNAATDFMGWYMVQTVEETGVAIDDTRNQYLAYHDGRSGYLRGTWRSKSWLIRIAGEVEARAVMYDQQLRACRKR
ncbi:lytic transglycosylase [Loktanella sp. D2R18]|uniref:transglycosylase SLT domain-containing protein n=1 Tax=Rhodobacterales TaxID=204455 RepID=UPI000DE86909|nr:MULTISPECIES: transglycosylase SLT domain-containing protein [Rhodobacterales]MCG3268635.1 transglycosylase SLT domain-containing protein [Yoonia sp. I 8.24]MDO6591782.1 transglycosylase SLT domain-containing protein [Yoonia sp. 1_MG-2023]RBW42300.1 lytic transglycosylase [Loktanella sp. D2R18]